MKIVLACGCFDVMHVGHVMHLEAAAKLGDMLCVALTEDRTVNKGEGLPIHNWDERARVLLALRCVSYVFPSVDAPSSIRHIRPDVYVKGVDYQDHPAITKDQAACDDVGAELVFTQTPKYSSTDIIRRLSGHTTNYSNV